MKKISGGIVLASVAGSAMATVCPLSMYNDSNLFENLMVAAVTDWSASGAGNGGTPQAGDKKATAAALGAALSDVTNGLPTSGVNLPLQNTALVSALNAGNACGTCAYNFYSKIWDATFVGYCSADPTASGAYHNKHYVNWYEISPSVPPGPNVLGVFQGFYCVNRIQSAIDAFNACANNGYDIRTGAFSTICTDQDDFLNVDAQFGAYSIMMDFALKNNLETPMPSDFVAAYTKLPCRSCFDSFITNAHATYATTWTGPGLCASGATPYTTEYSNAGTCTFQMPAFPFTTMGVGAALQEFAICAGIYNGLNTHQRFAPNTDDMDIFNVVIKSYQALATCSTGSTDPGAVSDVYSHSTNNASVDPAIEWLTCLNTTSSSLVLNTPLDYGCFQQFGHAIYSGPAKTACGTGSGHGPFTAGCLTALNTNTTNPDPTNFIASSADSPLMNLYKCAGFEYDTTATTCTTAQAATIDAAHKSFISVLEVTLKAGSDFLTAGRNVLANSDIMDAVADLPCAPCYSRLAAELSSMMQRNDVALCENPYSTECKESTNVVAALANFKSCAGFSLTNVSPSLCTDEEWGILQDANLVHETYDLVVPNNTQTLLEAKYDYSLLIAAVKSQYPTRLFKCDHCFQVLLDDLWVLEDSTLLECEAAITSAECFSLATLALSKFEACSGQDLDWVDVETTTAAPETTTAAPEETTTAAPVETTTVAPEVTTTAAPSTTKSVSSVMTTVSVVAVIALLL